MENFENAIIDNTIASEHPVLKQLKDRIAELETQLETNKATSTALDADRIQTINRIRNEKWQYEEKVKNVLVEALEDYDEATIKHIAEQLNVELTKTATIEVNVTFAIDVEYEIGSEPDPDWDFDFSVSHDSIVDYSSDVVWSKIS